jgi:TonB-dependent starch-binding outer membrane protein SusC
MKKLLLLPLLVLVLIQGFAQSRVIKGKVLDDAGKPLSGATVNVKGTTTSTITDAVGNFEVSTSLEHPVLVISFVGFEQQEFGVVNGVEPSIHLNLINQTLNDVVVVGYGTQQKKDVTGSIARVRSDEFIKRPLVKVEQALQGTVSGVAVQSNSGQPGQPMSVRIRGANSISAGNDPLYVIDGYIGGNINSLNMNDIESMEVLKDASATAIYGSRASNGVVIITTKIGREGPARIDFNPWFSKAEIPKKLSLMNAYQFGNQVNAQNATSGQPPAFDPTQLAALQAGPTTDWQNAVQQKPWIQNYDLSVSGGSPNVKYMFSFNHLDQPGLLINSYYKKTALRGNVDIKLNDRMNLKINVYGLLDNSRNNSFAGDITDPFAQAYQWDPTSPIRDATGAFIMKSQYASNATNPVAQLTNQADDKSGQSVTGTGIFTYRILNGLTFTSNSSYSFGSFYNQAVFPPLTAQGSVGNDYAETNDGKTSAYQSSNFLTYTKVFGDHAFTLLGLYEIQSFTTQNVISRATNLSTYSQGYYNMGLGASNKIQSAYSSDAQQSFMGRLNYAYKDKYLLTVSVRDDGSSHLTQKYTVFPAVGLGWNLGKEDVIANSKVISGLKIRASWGITGNQSVPAYATIPLILSGPQGPNGTSGYYYDGTTLTSATLLGGPVSQTLVWEKDKQTDVGVDLLLFHNRLSFTADYYHKEITNLLFQAASPYYNSGLNYATNTGSLENQGVEFSLGGTPVHNGHFTWSTNFTISFNTNKILDLGGRDSLTYNGIGSAQQNESILIVGKPLGAFYGYKFEGTWKTSEAAEAALYGMVPGDGKFADLNGDHKYNTADLMNIGNGTPGYTFGWINDLSYNDFTLSFMFQGSHGNQILSGSFPYMYGGLGDARNATSSDALGTWTAGQETDFPTISKTGFNPLNSSRFVYDASYIKLKNLSLAYNLPAPLMNKWKLRNVQIYVSAQNLFCITSYPGYDPEVTNANFTSTPAITQGLETGVVPNAKTYTFGLRVSL